MSQPSPSRLSTLYQLLFLLELLAVFSLFIAALFAAAAVLNDFIQVKMFSYLAVIGSGLLLGVASRLLLRHYSRLLQECASLLSVILAVFFLGWLTQNLAGNTLSTAGQTHPAWEAIMQIVAGGIGATLTVFAQPKKFFAKKETSATVIINPPASATQANTNGTAAKKKINLGERVRIALSGFSRSEPDPEIRLTGDVEHKCPYCLQMIQPRDARGIVTCPVCHTQHHKDCWDITGMCQVPHYHG